MRRRGWVDKNRATRDWHDCCRTERLGSAADTGCKFASYGILITISSTSSYIFFILNKKLTPLNRGLLS